MNFAFSRLAVAIGLLAFAVPAAATVTSGAAVGLKESFQLRCGPKESSASRRHLLARSSMLALSAVLGQRTSEMGH